MNIINYFTSHVFEPEKLYHREKYYLSHTRKQFTLPRNFVPSSESVNVIFSRFELQSTTLLCTGSFINYSILKTGTFLNNEKIGI